MRETMAQQTHDVVVDQTPLHVYMGMILDRLRAEHGCRSRRCSRRRTRAADWWDCSSACWN